MSVVHVQIGTGLHAVNVVLTSRKIRHVSYAAHPGLSTAVLAKVYTQAEGRGYTVCVCASFAHSLVEGHFNFIAAQIGWRLCAQEAHPTLLTQFGWCASFLKYLEDRIEVREKRNKRGT